MAFTRILGPGIHTASNINSHNIKSTGIITAVSFVGDGSGLTGVASTDNIITGTAATFNTYPVDINAGMTVAGVSSFSGGISGTTANFSGNVSIGGTLTYEDVTNIDSVGLITARDGIFLPNNKHISLGTGNDMRIYSAAGGLNNSFLKKTGTGPLNFDFQGDFLVRNTNGTMRGKFTGPLGAVELYYSGQKKFETSAKGIQVGTGVTIETNGQATYTGIVTATAFKLANGSDVGTGAGGTWSTYTAGIATSKSVGVNTSSLDDNDLVGVGNSFQGLYISNGMMMMDNTLNGDHYIGTAFNGLMAGPVNINGTLSIDGNYVVV